MLQKMHFWQKALGVNGLQLSTICVFIVLTEQLKRLLQTLCQ